MAGSLNRVMLIGRLGADPKLAYAASGQPVANFNMATDESYVDKGGNKVERTEWHRVVVFGRQAEMVGNYLSKGRLVFVEGRLQTRDWEDQQGQKRYTTEVVAQRVQFLDSKGAGGGQGGGGSGQGYGEPMGDPGFDDYAGPGGAPHGAQGGGQPRQAQARGGHGGPQGGYGGRPQQAPSGPSGVGPSEGGDMDDIPF